jgi:hypothetical protein
VATTGNVALVRRLYEAVWNQGDLAAADALISPSEVHHSRCDVCLRRKASSGARSARPSIGSLDHVCSTLATVLATVAAKDSESKRA